MLARSHGRHKMSKTGEIGRTAYWVKPTQVLGRPVAALVLLTGVVAIPLTVAVASPMPVFAATSLSAPYQDAGYLGAIAGYPFDDGNDVGPWKFDVYECTSYVAYRLNEAGVAFSDTYKLPKGADWGDAGNWIAAAKSAGVPSGTVPEAGAVAVWASQGSGPLEDGHVAFVASVSNGIASFAEYNAKYYYPEYNPPGYDTSTSESNPSGEPPTEYLYFPNVNLTSSVAVIPTSDGHVQVFSDADGVLEENWYDPATGQHGDGSAVGGMTVAGTPALVARSGQSVIDAFVRNSAGQIVETWYNWGNGDWGGWIAVSPGPFTSDPSAVATSDGHDQIFATASGGTLEENWFDPATGQHGDGSAVGGMTVAGTPALVARSGQSVIDAFVRNSAGQIVETWYNWGNGDWGGWIAVSPGPFTSDPSAVATSDGHDQIFATASGGTLEENWFDPATGQHGDGSAVGGMTVAGTPALVARSGQSVIDAFVRNSAGQIVETWYNWGNGDWGGWRAITGATFTYDPSAVATSDGNDQIFDNNGAVEQNWFDPATGDIGDWIVL